jgi:two-component system cell cycle sensor histidine kinase/response regulator CckA
LAAERRAHPSAREVGAGSTFTIYLPRVFEPLGVGRPRTEAESESGSGSILVVEDEKSVRSLVKRILERGGYTVTEAESGEEAVRICQDRPEGFDLLITDIVLPGMRGDEVAGSVRRLSPRARTIYMSGYVEERHAPKLEGVKNLRKPISANALLAEVKKALGQGRSAGSIGP